MGAHDCTAHSEDKQKQKQKQKQKLTRHSWTVTAAAVAATASTALYLDGKYAVNKDIRDIRRMKAVVKLYTEAGKYSVALPSIPTC